MSKDIKLHFLQDIFILDSVNDFESQLVQQCFDIVGVFIAAIDVKGKITFMNKAGIELLDLQEDEVIGSDFIENFIAPEEREKTRKLIHSLIFDRHFFPDTVNYRLQLKNQRKITLEARNVIIRDKDNNRLGILISAEDVTEFMKSQHELRNTINLYRMLASNLPSISLFLFDRERRFIIAEGKEMEDLGLGNESFVGKRLDEIEDRELQQIWEPLFREAMDGGEVSTEYKFRDKYFLVSVLPVRDHKGEVIMGVTINQEITSMRRTEFNLKQAKNEAEKANRAKSEFLARVSHEIRTPLNAILGFTEQLLQTELDTKQEDYVKIIDKSSEHLLSLINDILVLSKIEAQQIRFDNIPFKIDHTLKYVFSTLSTKAEDKHLRFRYDMDEAVDMVLMGDPFRLRQILINMLNNAIKFTKQGYVELKCFLHKEERQEVQVRFDIIDTGIGIKAGNLETIFEQFNQADPVIAKQYGGTGLGLTICKNLIELQKGSLTVSSQENVGTTFTFIIPYKKARKKDIANADTGRIDTEKLKGKKVLLVDDDSVNRLLGLTILNKLNCEVEMAHNGSEAIEFIDTKPFDIVLLDIHMPDISGVEVARHLRSGGINRSVKVVAVTAAVMKDDIEEYYRSGIDDFLVKPFKEIHLYNKMCDVMDLKGKETRQTSAEIILKEEIIKQTYSLEELKSMAGGDREFIRKMLDRLINNSEETLKSFRSDMKEGNWEQIGEKAHKIIPSYRHIQATSLAEKLLKIKTLTLIEPDVKAVPSLLTVVIREMKELLKQLKKDRKRLSG